jgi:hypothetical protein
VVEAEDGVGVGAVRKTGEYPDEALDGGFASKAEIERCTERVVILYAPWPNPRTTPAVGINPCPTTVKPWPPGVDGWGRRMPRPFFYRFFKGSCGNRG